jgi:hypothetical protein
MQIAFALGEVGGRKGKESVILVLLEKFFQLLNFEVCL